MAFNRFEINKIQRPDSIIYAMFLYVLINNTVSLEMYMAHGNYWMHNSLYCTTIN